MVFRNRGPHAPKASRRKVGFRPLIDGLEDRKLLATLDLANVDTNNLGVQEIGKGATSGSIPTPGFDLPITGAGYNVVDVGDVDGDTYDDFLIGAPGVGSITGNGATIGGGNSTVYLVFGSRSVTSASNIDFNQLTTIQRIGDLGQLGATTQTNIKTTATDNTGFPFQGIAFITSANGASGLGASMASLGDINGSGVNSFIIGAPNDTSGGRAYVVYGGSALRGAANRTVDLEPTNGNLSTPTKVVTFTNPTLINSQTGAAVAGIGSFLSQSRTSRDIAIGAPAASISSTTTTGVVYVVSGAAVNGLASGAVVDLATVGQTNGIGLAFTGVNNDGAGFSLAGAFNFDSDNAGSIPIQDLLIGAPGANNTGNGRAYLIYGTSSITLGQTFDLANVGADSSINDNAIPGVIFTGSANNRLGYSVSSAGDFNADGVQDVLLGAPSQGSNTPGYASLIYGRSGTSTAGRINGVFPLAASPSLSIPFTNFIGESTGDLAGYSVTAMNDANGDGVNEIAIGAPGFNGLTGAAYVIPGNLDLLGVQNLSNTYNNPGVGGSRLTVSDSSTVAFLGGSLSGRLNVNPTQNNTVDADLLGDLIIGAPGYTPNYASTNRTNAGTAYAALGARLGLTVPNNVYQPAIGVGSPTAPFSISATTPNALDIYVFSIVASGTTPAFAPVTDVNPATIVVNGVAFPNPSNFGSVGDLNNDGINDLRFTISRSQLSLTAGSTVTFFVSGRTTTNRFFVGQTPVTITGGGGGGTGTIVGVGTVPTLGAVPVVNFIPPYGEALVPTARSLEKFSSYKVITVKQAMGQFRPSGGFKLRMLQYKNPGQYTKKTRGTLTLDEKVFTRGKYHAGKRITYTHKQAVLPRGRQKESYKSPSTT